MLVCNGCRHAPDVYGGKVDTVWYCSPDCQIADRNQHRLACQKARDRRALYRAGATSQLAFYRYLEKFPDKTIRKVEKKGEDLVVCIGHPNGDNVAKLPFSWNDCDSEDRLAVLTLMKCEISTGFTHVLVDIMLPDAVQQVLRLDYKAKGHRRRVTVVDEEGFHDDNTTKDHAIVKVTLNNGETYAIDITGPQYGHHDPVVPWDLYARSRVREIITASPLRDVEESQKEAGSKAGGVGPHKTEEELFAEIFVAAAKSWQVRNGPLDGLMKMREETFKKKQASLVDFIDEEVARKKKARGVEELPADILRGGFNC